MFSLDHIQDHLHPLPSNFSPQHSEALSLQTLPHLLHRGLGHAGGDQGEGEPPTPGSSEFPVETCGEKDLCDVVCVRLTGI